MSAPAHAAPLPAKLLFELWRHIDLRLRGGAVLITPDHFLQAMRRDFRKIIGVAPSPGAERAMRRAIEEVNRRYPGTYLNQGIKNAVTRYLRDLESRSGGDADVRQRIKEMVKGGQTAFFLESIGVDVGEDGLPETIESAILKVVEGQKLQAPQEYRPTGNKPRRRHTSPLLAAAAAQATAQPAADEERPAQEPMPDAAEQAARETEEAEAQAAIAQAEMETVVDRLDAMRARGVFNEEEVVELRKVLELDGQVRRGEIDEDEAEKMRAGFDQVLHERLRQRLGQTVDESAALINALEALKRLPPERDAALSYLPRHRAAVVADEGDPIVLKALEALEADDDLLTALGTIMDRKDQEVRMMVAKLPPYRQLIEAAGETEKLPQIEEGFIAEMRQLSREALSQRLNGDDDERLPLLKAARALIALIERVVEESPFHREVRRLKIRQTLTRLYESTDGGKEGRHTVQHFLKRRLRKLYPTITAQECSEIEAESVTIMEAIDKGEKPDAGKDRKADRRVYRA